MASDLGGELERRGVPLLVQRDLTPEILLGSGEIVEPGNEQLGAVQPADVGVLTAVSEPAAHLKQGVVVRGQADVIRDQESLDGDTPGKLVPSDQHGLEGGLLLEVSSVQVVGV